ncbi:hypothetical protein [Streptomyces sp. NPDC055287]
MVEALDDGIEFGRRHAERDTQKIVKEKGGRGLKVEDIRISYDFGPDVGSAKITARDSKGGDYSENLTITRDDGRRYLTILPAPKRDPSGRTPAATSPPSDEQAHRPPPVHHAPAAAFVESCSGS